MSKPNQKIKLLIMYEILRSETDLDHPLTTEELVSELIKAGIQCDRRTVPGDIKLLNEYDYEVMSVKKGKYNAYYVPEHDFTVSELKILIDAVQAAGFITYKKTRSMIGKIASLSSRNIGNLLSKDLVFYNATKHSNESILYNVDRITEAIEKNLCISFNYFKLDHKGQKVYRNERKRYVADPVALVLNDDCYYVYTYNKRYRNKTTYRIDRIDNVEIVNERADPVVFIMREELPMHVKQTFKMYTGEVREVHLSFGEEVLNPVFDKFGENIVINRIGDELFETDVMVQISPTFYGWISQFGTSIEITAPADVRQQMRDLIDAVGAKYHRR